MQASGFYPRPVGSASLGVEPGNWHLNRLSGVGVEESRVLKFNNKYCSEDPSPPRRCPGLCMVVIEGVRFGLLRTTGNPTTAPKRLNTQVGLKGHIDGEQS